MIYRKILVAATSLLLLCSCSTLVSSHYVGEAAPVFSEDLVERAWYVGGHVWHVKPINNHQAIAATLAWHHGHELFEQQEMEFLVTTLGKGVFLNIKQEDNNYTILRLLPAFSVGCEFALITVNSTKVSEDIAQRRIRGEGIGPSDWGDTYKLNVGKRELDRYVEENLNALFDTERLIIGNSIPRGAIGGFHDDRYGC